MSRVADWSGGIQCGLKTEANNSISLFIYLFFLIKVGCGRYVSSKVKLNRMFLFNVLKLINNSLRLGYQKDSNAAAHSVDTCCIS